MRYLQYCSLVTAGLLALVVARPAAADAPADKTALARGRITEVRAGDSQFTLHTRKEGDLKLTVDPQSQIEVNNRAGKLADLKPGMRVRVTYETKGGTNRVVSVTDPLITLEKVQRAANKAFDVAKSYTFQQRDQYQQKLQGLTQDIDERIEDLEDRAADAGAAARQRYAAEIKELRQKRAVLQEKMTRVGSATAQSWEDIRNGVNAAIDDVQRSIQRARTDAADQK